ncbi:TPA: hypothetical protein DDW69_04475 [candidate division CPR2 bacterium]|uniref:Nickel-dependent hydrogenase n=1 Tax=candidate division CPR2 bacterium GW2011_GWC1_41_48 TaxID=1618344 RepID=A0A0G0W8I3_UNCC2|nr:MAG: Nickel-dependent hydrogenase [candidate division CPR2 bacterium GW2011_GWC2_39_35]KKR28332.1 MAG: Nickel-dependent hydrogenase [candidate division CPR2 bacterium GW2011_GWD1_39_7]KKR29085.1 MAG: Nickel-dependent hydrogenase [candidate division CPR2 bacterium GW2011_GWD2_39_7]KKS09299.1 MAG: Nickel-dependent hydrogenase [candidate division CPR2 bacterium GW2011_GWC1_41_48]OGB60574.1 MAG: hypothetical protein A2Y27_01685 [candidate division CPR2 bacterium GWD1_39_7]OGB70573.1 MAG: hypoth
MKSLMNNYITKIEGHGNLKVNFNNEKVELHVEEGERLFEGLILGRYFEDGPIITARICGVCPTAHTFASITALENALDIKVSDHIATLRKVMLSLQIFQSHVLHLFFLAIPDYLGIDNSLELATANPEVFNTVLSLKRLADEGIELIGGRPIHPITAVVGGFTKLPEYKDLDEYKKKIEKSLIHAIEAAKIFKTVKYPEVENEKEYLALLGSNYPLTGEVVVSSLGKGFEVKDYQKVVTETVKSYSTAKFSTKDGKGFMVGAISRLNLKYPLLNKEAFGLAEGEFPTHNPFKNNLAQAIELVHYMEEIIELIGSLKDADLSHARDQFEVKAGVGAGCIEAPRGLLFHYYELNSKGIITKCDIITPTALNLTSIEDDAEAVLKTNGGISQAKREHELEMLVRAYDPCITCSVH